MRPPCEVVVRQLLPVLRALVARELMESYGWTQSRIAERLGVTQPAVSGYLALLDKEIGRRFGLEEVATVAKSIAAGLATRELTLPEALSSVCELCIKLKCGGIICALHKQRVPELSEEACEICLHLFARGIEPIGERYKALTNIRKAVSMIEESDDFLAIMPEVRVNVAMAVPGAKTVSEVAGIPGRIVEVRGRARAFTEPEFGASFHMAKVLLGVMDVDKKIRAVTNIRYDEAVGAAVEKLGLDFSQLDRTEFPEEAMKSEAPITWGVMKVTKESKRVPDVIVDKGGYGIEPAAYIFGGSAVEAVKKAIQIARAVAKSK